MNASAPFRCGVVAVLVAVRVAVFAGVSVALPVQPAVGLVLVVLLTWHGFTNRDVVLTAEARQAMEQGLHTGPGAGSR